MITGGSTTDEGKDPELDTALANVAYSLSATTLVEGTADYVVVMSSSVQESSKFGEVAETKKDDPKCDCITSKLFPHRKSKCQKAKVGKSVGGMLSKVGNAVAPGIFVRNESDHQILVVLSQLSPLHWTVIKKNQTAHIKCGRVYFTVSTEFYNEKNVPTEAEVVARISLIAATTVFTGGLLGVGVVGGLSAFTSSKSVKMDGVLADGKCLVIAGRTNDSDLYELYIKGLESA